MRGTTSNSVLASEIAEFLGSALHGDDVVVYGPKPVDGPENNCVIFCEQADALNPDALSRCAEVLILSRTAPHASQAVSFILVPKPKVSFATIVDHYFTREIAAYIHPTAVVEAGAVIGSNVTLAAGCYIGPEVSIGDGSSILHNVVITGRVVIGEGCVIKANATIGSEIFDFVYAGSEWTQYPQVGCIRIGNHVWVGASSTIERGALTDTVIHNGAKIDDLVQVGSGASIGPDSRVAAGSIICRDVRVGRRCWIAPHVTILERRAVGDESVIGVGAVVLEDVPSRSKGSGH